MIFQKVAVREICFCKAGISLDHCVDLTITSIGSFWCNPTLQVSLHSNRSGPASTPFPCPRPLC
uniref:Uncharacterized protein n=1 Tax=Anguilla anguilla TaxID=7936 RepID=A0A0E9X3X8_ANGAN